MLSRMVFGAMQAPCGKAGSVKLSLSPRDTASSAKPLSRKKLIIASTHKTAAANKVRCASVTALSRGAAAPKPASRGMAGKSRSQYCKRVIGILKRRVPTPASGGKSRPVYSEGGPEGNVEQLVLATLAGPNQELDADHLIRHPRAMTSWRTRCPRCAYLCHRTSWEQKTPLPQQLGSRTWLTPSPAFSTRAWGLGCAICVAASQSMEFRRLRDLNVKACKERNIDRRTLDRFGRWSRFDIRRLVRQDQACTAIQEHACSETHKAALAFFAGKLARPLPQVAPEARAQPVAREDTAQRTAEEHSAPQPVAQFLAAVNAPQPVAREDVFRGRVPQVTDWLDAWANSSSSVSFRKQAKIASKRMQSAYRSQRSKQVRVMAEIVRDGIRKRLREADSITIAVDEAQARKILRLRCVPRPPFFRSIF